MPTRPHCDAGGSGPVAMSAVSGARTALFPGGITQRSAPDFASVVSKLAASASGPGEVAASALRTQALQTGMARPCRLPVSCSRLRASFRCRSHRFSGAGADHGVSRCACGASVLALQRVRRSSPDSACFLLLGAAADPTACLGELSTPLRAYG